MQQLKYHDVMQVKDTASAGLQSQLSQVQHAHDGLAQQLNNNDSELKAAKERFTSLREAQEQAAEEAICDLKRTVQVYFCCMTRDCFAA